MRESKGRTRKGDKGVQVRGKTATCIFNLHPFFLLTCSVRETLDFAAKLRLPASTTKHERQGVVESLMSTLGLKDCAEVRVGDSEANEAGDGGKRGISGGERRRVSAAIQLLTRPNLLLCDEVTSGML